MRSRAAALGVIAMTLLVLGLALGACEREQKAVREDLAAARETKVRADLQQIAAAVRVFQATSGALPGSLETLTQPSGSGGPVLRSIPAPPAGWSPYAYARLPGERFTLSSSGGGVTVRLPD